MLTDQTDYTVLYTESKEATGQYLQGWNTPVQPATSPEQKQQPATISMNLYFSWREIHGAKVFFTEGLYFGVIQYENKQKKRSRNIQNYFRKERKLQEIVILQLHLLASPRFSPATDMPGKKVSLYSIPKVTGQERL